MTSLKRLLMWANAIVRRRVFANPHFIRRVFGVAVVATPEVQSYCEWGSLLQRLILHRYARPGMKLLDLGSGAHALLAIFAKQRFPGIFVTATDILPDRVALAKKTAEYNQASIEFTVADMFSGISSRFNIVLFAPPAIPTSELQELGFDPISYPSIGTRYCWASDGGSDGCDIIRQFLSSVGNHLEENGRVIMTVNPIHCSTTTIKRLCLKARLNIQCVHRLPGIINAYVLSHQQKKDGL